MGGGIAIVIIFGCVFGSFIMSGGKMDVIIEAAPHELMTIFGAAVGAFILGNKGDVAKATLKDLKKAFSGPKWKAQDFKDLLALMFTLLKLIRTKGMIALEQHIEKPEESPIFKQYEKITHDHFAVEFICDNLRMMTMNFEDPNQVESVMDGQLEKHHNELHARSHAVQQMADGMPALGIVAAVLGVIKTMGSITAPVEVLGAMIGGALTGTFLGVFLAYGFIGPISGKMNQSYEQDHLFYLIIRAVLISHLQGNAPQVSVEIGRGMVPSHFHLTFPDLEAMLQTVTIPS